MINRKGMVIRKEFLFFAYQLGYRRKIGITLTIDLKNILCDGNS